MGRLATLVVIEGQFRVVVFNPNGVTGDSPGQRPGFRIKSIIASPEGAERGDAWIRLVLIEGQLRWLSSTPTG
jgi:hypothetical protein